MSMTDYYITHKSKYPDSCEECGNDIPAGSRQYITCRYNKNGELDVTWHVYCSKRHAEESVFGIQYSAIAQGLFDRILK